MKIAVITPNYVSSLECNIIDGLVSLGHSVYNLQGPAINYAESWPIPSPEKIDLLFVMDTDNELAMTIPPERMGDPLKSAKKIIIHTHDRFTNYVNAPNSPIKEVPVDKINTKVVFVRDLDILTEQKFKDKGIEAFPLDYAIERRYAEAVAPFLEGERKNEMVFLGTLDTARRRYYLDKVKEAGLAVRYGTYEYNNPDGKWSKYIYGRYTHDPKYYEELCKYTFCFIPIGAGCSTMRMGECYSAGCIPVIQKYPDDIVPYYDFMDCGNCILWSDEKELIGKLSYYMNDTFEATLLRDQCYEFGVANMLSSHLAQYILDKCREHGLIT